jgi:hypothetical protein
MRKRKRVLAQALASAIGDAVIAKGQFEVFGESNLAGDVLTTWRVKWSEAQGG